MIQANELRIGNYVKDSTHEVSKVRGVFKDEIYLSLEGGNLETNLENIHPIPITEDILLKAGFTSRKPGEPSAIWDCPKENFSMIVFLNPPERKEWRTGATTGSASCNTVHQLQNLYFALTGEELTINF